MCIRMDAYSLAFTTAIISLMSAGVSFFCSLCACVVIALKGSLVFYRGASKEALWRSLKVVASKMPIGIAISVYAPSITWFFLSD